MATYKPLRIGDATRGETTPIRTFAEGDTIDPAFLPGGGGGASYTEITYNDMVTAVDTGTLTPGGWYLITDASGTDLGFLTYAVNENTISVQGVGGYLNADFQAAGDYTGVEAETGVLFMTPIGIWRQSFEEIAIPYMNLTGGTFAVGDTITGQSTGATAVITSDNGTDSMTVYMTSPGVAFDGSEVLDNGGGVSADMNGAAGVPDIQQGDVVIWNLLHWQLTDISLLNGTDPATNTAAYTLLAKTAANVGYITAWDVSEFDFHNSWLQYRADLLGNLIRYSKGIDDQNFGYGFSIIPFFQWGNQTWYGNISNDGAIYQPNSAGFQAAGNVLYPGAFVADNVADKTHYFQVNTMFPFSEYRYNNLLATDNYTAYRQNTQQAYSSFNSNTIGDRTEVVNNTLFPNASVSSVSISDNPSVNNAIANNILENGAQLTGITAGANCSISRNKVGQGATLGGSTTMGDGAAITDNTLANGYSLDTITLAAAETIDSLNYGQITAIDETTRDGLIIPQQGLVILNTTSGKLNFYTGSAWEEITSA